MKEFVTFISVLSFWLAVDVFGIVALAMIPLFIVGLFASHECWHSKGSYSRPLLRLTSTGVHRNVHHRKSFKKSR